MTFTNAEIRAHLHRIAADAFEQTIRESSLGSTLTVREVAELRIALADQITRHPAYTAFAVDETGPELPGGWVPTDAAAALAGIAPNSFRREVTRSPELQRARGIVAGSTVYRRDSVKEWLAGRPGKGNRTPRLQPAECEACGNRYPADGECSCHTV
jgi:hypothetical protein